MNSEDFKKRLIKAGDITFKTGRESKFSVMVNFDDRKIVYSKALIGSCDSTYEERDLSIDYSSFHYLIDVHFHPSKDEVIGPSCNGNGIDGADLGGLSEMRKSLLDMREERENNINDIRPIMGIGQIRNNRTIDLLLIQENTKMPIDSNYFEFIRDITNEEYENMLNKRYDLNIEERNNISAIILKNTGIYNAEYLNFRNYKYLKGSLRKLKSFENCLLTDEGDSKNICKIN